MKSSRKITNEEKLRRPVDEKVFFQNMPNFNVTIEFMQLYSLFSFEQQYCGLNKYAGL